METEDMGERAGEVRGSRPPTKGTAIRIHLYEEILDELDDFIKLEKRHGRAGSAKGEEGPAAVDAPGRPTHVGAIVAAFIRLSDEDRERFFRDGAEAMAACRAQGAGYAGGLPFGRHRGSIFAPAPEKGRAGKGRSVAGGGAAGVAEDCAPKGRAGGSVLPERRGKPDGANLSVGAGEALPVAAERLRR